MFQTAFNSPISVFLFRREFIITYLKLVTNKRFEWRNFILCVCFYFDKKNKHHWKRHRNSNYVWFYFSSWFLFHNAIAFANKFLEFFMKYQSCKHQFAQKTQYFLLKQHENCKVSKTIDSVYGFNWNMWNVKQNSFANDIDCILFSLFTTHVIMTSTQVHFTFVNRKLITNCAFKCFQVATLPWTFTCVILKREKKMLI